MYSWAECREKKTVCRSHLPVGVIQENIRILFGDNSSLTEGRMFASVLFRRIFFPLAIISLGLYLLMACQCIFLIKQYIYESEHEDAIRSTRQSAKPVPGNIAETADSRKADDSGKALSGMEYGARKLRNRLILSFSAVYILFLLILAALLNYFLRSLKYLGNMAEEFIRKGRVSEKRFVADRGETGLLSWAMYRMTGQIEENMRKIKFHDSEIANLIRANDRARERAYDLGKINEKLECRVRMYRDAEESLRQSEERYRAMLENIEECFYEADLFGNLVFFNDALCRMLGYSKEELLAMNFRDFMDENTAEKAYKTFKNAFEKDIPAKGFEWTLIRKDGSPCYVEISVFLIKDENGEILGFRGVARNISDLLYLIYHDPLTGLYNRKAFFQRMKETLAYARRDNNEKNIFYLDLDRFKQVNDVYGHDIGDEILKEVAARLKSTLRETDHICRLGGDEFTVILNNAACPNPAGAARRIIESLSRPYIVKEHLIDFITPSIGISAYPGDATDIETLVKCADIAMYESKKTKGCFTFYDKSLEEAGKPQKE
ncbi:MAG: diguanylate cyclase [Desulfococcaceae bacterium]